MYTAGAEVWPDGVAAVGAGAGAAAAVELLVLSVVPREAEPPVDELELSVPAY